MKLFLSGGEHRHWRHPEGRCRQPIPQSIHAGGCRCLSDKILLDWVSFFFFFFFFLSFFLFLTLVLASFFVVVVVAVVFVCFVLWASCFCIGIETIYLLKTL